MIEFIQKCCRIQKGMIMSLAALPTKSRKEFEQLYQAHHRRAYNLAYRLTSNSTDAEDVTQEAFVRAWNSFNSYDHSKSFEAWLFKIITNRVIDIHRRRNRVKIFSIDTPIQSEYGGREQLHDIASPDLNPEQILIHSVMEESLQKALAGLTTEYRSTLLHSDIDEMSYQEIADSMHCAIGTVRSRLHRARGILRKALEKDTSMDYRVTGKSRTRSISDNSNRHPSREKTRRPIAA